MRADDLREGVAQVDPLATADDIPGLVLGLAAWLAVLILAPVLVLVLAVVLLPFELVLVAAAALLLVLARLLGVVPWTVLVLDVVSGAEEREQYRNGLRARRRILEVNADQRVPVRWAWT
jgi:hypothetical protein